MIILISIIIFIIILINSLFFYLTLFNLLNLIIFSLRAPLCAVGFWMFYTNFIYDLNYTIDFSTGDETELDNQFKKIVKKI